MRPRSASALTDARARTLMVLNDLTNRELIDQHSPLMSPLVWDLAHIAHFEEFWLIRELGIGDATNLCFDDMYDAFAHPRSERPTLDILDPEAARAFGAAVRERVWWSEVAPDASDRVSALVRDDFVYGMVIRHEHQHIETMLATIQLMGHGAPAAAGDGPGREGNRDLIGCEVLIPAGPFVMGTDTDQWAYDNERPAHAADLPAFFIDVTPATNAQYARFVDAGGYHDPGWWSDEGWKWRQAADLTGPAFWIHGEGGWTRRRFGRIEPLPEYEPVQHIGWYEADAYARWAGKRLPTEAEWEKAASWDPGTGDATKESTVEDAALWGATQRWAPDDVGAHPGGASPWGVLDMLGGVWEWSATDFAGYPGFEGFPYPEYSEVFFGPEFKVLRGGSWATHPVTVSTTFRNWDYPIRRQIFSGVRCARDA